MRVLVTGGAGFIGSHVVEHLVARGDRVTLLDNLDPWYPSATKLRNLAAVRDRVDFVVGDLLDAPALEASMDGVDAVIHLAARAGVRPSLQDPAPYVRTNVEGTLRVLVAMNRLGVEHLVNVSSSSVYGARTTGPFSETDPPATPASPYAASKLAAEIMCDTWQRLHHLSITTVRLFTVYGPRQRPDMAIHRFARSLLAGRSLTLFGDGTSCRDYTYVGDVVRGIVAAVDRPGPYRVFNLGNSTPISLRDLVSALGTAVGVVPRVEAAPDQPGDVPMTWADIQRARRDLDYDPSTRLPEGLARFVAWLRREMEAERSLPPGGADLP